MAKKKKAVPVQADGAPATPPPPAVPADPVALDESPLSLRWHLITLAVITAIVLAVFFSYKLFIRAWADDHLDLARGYLELAPALKTDYLSQADGYSPVAEYLEKEVAATVSFQATLVALQERLSQAEGTPTVIVQAPPDLRDQLRTRRTSLARVASEVLAHPPHPVPAALQGELDRTIIALNEITAKLAELETTVYASPQEFSDAIFRTHLLLNNIILKQFRHTVAMFDYVAALEMAAEEARRAIGGDNQYADAFDVLARALEEKNELPEAANQYVAVVELDPHSTRAGEIVAAYEKQAAEVPADLIAHYTLGRLYRARGERDKALAALAKVIELDGGQPDTPQTLTGYYARTVQREVLTGQRDEFIPGREG